MSSREPSREPKNGTSASPAPQSLVVNEMIVTFHKIYDMPEAMARQDNTKVYEMVIKTIVKFYSNKQRVAHVDLATRMISFSPQDIALRNGRYELDFAQLAKARSGGSTPQRPQGGGGMRNSVSDSHTASEAVDPSNPFAVFSELPIQYPSRSDLKCIVELAVGVRERFVHSTSTRWLTAPLEPGPRASEVATFATAESELVRHKIVTRFVGLLVGHLSCSMRLPYATADLTHVPVPADHSAVPQAFTDNLVLNALDRLEKDQQRLQFLYRPPTPVQVMSRAQLEAALLRGESEWMIYRSLLLEYNPTYFVEQAQKIIDFYPPTPQHMPWAQQPADTLVEQYAGNELQLIRDLSAELGPSLSSISPRTRRFVFLWFYQEPPIEDLNACVRERFGAEVDINDFLDNEPDLYMDTVCAKYGPELIPTRYYFPMVTYLKDNRSSFRDVLRACTLESIGQSEVGANGNSTTNNCVTGTSDGSAGVSAAVAAAIPPNLLELTPNERPLQLAGSSGGAAAGGNEIDILSQKYAEQFQFLVDPIAKAITRVISEDPQPPRDAAVLPKEFKVFESEVPQLPAQIRKMVQRCGAYTYISPSTLLATLIFLDRLCMRFPDFTLTAYNIRNLFTTMARVASKVVDLRSINNKNFARVFDVRLLDFNIMEDRLLKLMDFNFMLTPGEFNDYAMLVRDPTGAALAVPSSVRGSVAVGNPGGAMISPVQPRPVDAVVTEDASPMRADSMPLGGRTVSGRRASCSSTQSASGLVSASATSVPHLPATSSRRLQQQLQPPAPSMPSVARSYDATSRQPLQLGSSSARPGSGM